MDITMIGHISKDIMQYVDGVQKFTGGPVVYSSAAAVKAGKKVSVLTRASAEDDSALDAMRALGVEVKRLDSPATTSIKNIYHTADCERRDVILLSRALPFDASIASFLTGKIIHLAGLFRGEIPEDLIPLCAEHGRVAIDAQGLLRCNEDGELTFRDWDNKLKYLPMISYLKTDAAEAEILTGLSDRIEAAVKLASWGAREVMVTHNTEVLVYSGGRIYTAPFTPRTLVGRTGRGDTAFAAYLAWRMDHPPEEAVAFAAGLCSLKMEAPGPYSGTLMDAINRAEKDSGIRLEV
ncbi:PfkB family carbohydrate kinase [Treponema sp.]